MKRDILTVAFPTDDEVNFINRHFGDATMFALYTISPNKLKYKKSVLNKSEEEKTHADPKKAKSISKILKEQNVDILVGRAFGGNILRMKKHFVCVKCDFTKIEDSFETLLKNFDRIVVELQKGEARDYLVI